MFGSSYCCEQLFSKIKYTKSRIRSQLSDRHLNDILLLSTSSTDSDIESLFHGKQHPRVRTEVCKIPRMWTVPVWHLYSKGAKNSKHAVTEFYALLSRCHVVISLSLSLSLSLSPPMCICTVYSFIKSCISGVIEKRVGIKFQNTLVNFP